MVAAKNKLIKITRD